MARESVPGVRQAIELTDRPRRRLEERLCLRVPSLARLSSRLLWHMPPRSRARRAFLLRASQMGFDSTNRADFDAAFLLYDANVELIPPHDFVDMGFDPIYRGRTARLEFQRRWTDDWGEMRFEPEELIDLGEQLLFVGRVKGSGRTSGAGIESDWAVLFTLSPRGIVREQPVFDRREAFEAAGIAPTSRVTRARAPSGGARS